MGLKEKRQASHMTQKEAAALFEIKYRTYQNYENGVTTPDMETAAKFARYFNCSIGELFDLKEGMVVSERAEDERLLAMFHLLNGEGRFMAFEYIDTLVKSGKYEKKTVQDHSISVSKVS